MKNKKKFEWRRRQFLKSAATFSAVGLTSSSAIARNAPSVSNQINPGVIAEENRRPGSNDWQLTNVRVDKSGIRCPSIEGYCSKQSLKAGEEIDIFVSLNPVGVFKFEFFRMGFYGGSAARLMKTVGPLKGQTQADPDIGARRIRECKWKSSYNFKIPEDWVSGVYLGRLTRTSENNNEPAWQSYVIFIVTDDRKADVLFQCSDNTWQAYNRWPDTYSLYDEEGKAWSLTPEVDVSFDRPYGKYRQIYENPQSLGSGEFLCWEFPLCYFLEEHGYDVTYCANRDLLTPERGSKCKTFLSVGHDEYWDLRQFASVKKLIANGINAMFLSGNSVCFVSPFRDSSGGNPHRIIQRQGCYGSMTEKEKKVMPLMEAVGPDESFLIGARTVIPFNGGGDWIIEKPEHWLFENTGLKKGDRIAGLVGWEFHGDPAEIKGLEILAKGTAVTGGGQTSNWTATIYPGPKNNFVFNASTIFWSQGLSSPPGHMLPWVHNTRPHGTDSRVQQITHNALKRAIG